MSDVKERWEIYEKVCKDRFTSIENKVDDLHSTVKNGLTDKVNALWRLAWILVTGLIGLLAVTVFDLLVNH